MSTTTQIKTNLTNLVNNLQISNHPEDTKLTKALLETILDDENNGLNEFTPSSKQNEAHALQSLRIAVTLLDNYKQHAVTQSSEDKPRIKNIHADVDKVLLETFVENTTTDAAQNKNQNSEKSPNEEPKKALNYKPYQIPKYSETVSTALDAAKALITQLYDANCSDNKTLLTQLIYQLYKNKQVDLTCETKTVNGNPVYTVTWNNQTLEGGDNSSAKILYDYHQSTKKLENEAYDRLERTFKTVVDSPKKMLTLYSLPIIGSVYFKTKGYDTNLYYILSSLYSISGYSHKTKDSLDKLYRHIFKSKTVTKKRDRMDLLFQWLAGVNSSEEQNSLLHYLQQPGKAFVAKSNKNEKTFLREMKKAMNRLLRDSGYTYRINSETRTYFDKEGEKNEFKVYQDAIFEDRELASHNRSWWKFYLVIAATLSAAIVGPGQGVIAANGFYQSAALIAQMVKSIPLVGHTLGTIFGFLALHPVALMWVVLTIFLSSSFTNFYLFGGDALDTLKLMANGKLFENFSIKKRILGYVALLFAASMGFTIAGLTLYSMLHLIVPVAAATILPLAFLQAVAVFTTGFTFFSVSLVMVAALVGKIRNNMHQGIGRYLINLFLPFVNIFKLTHENTTTIIDNFEIAAKWDQEAKPAADKWRHLSIADRNALLKTVFANLIEKYQGNFTKKFGFQVGSKADLSKFVNLIETLKKSTKLPTLPENCPKALTEEIKNLTTQMNLKGADAPTKAWKVLRKKFSKKLSQGPVLTKTQRQQYEWAMQFENASVWVRLGRSAIQFGKVLFLAFGLSIAALACLATAIAWRQASAEAMVYFNMASHIAEYLSVIVVYCLTAPVIAMFFGASIIRLFSEMTNLTATQGFGYNNSANDKMLLKQYKKQGPAKGTASYYIIHIISYGVVSLFAAALLINAVGNALVSLISGDQFQHNLGSMHIHFNLLQAQFVAFICTFFASMSVNFFPIRKSMQDATPHLTLHIDDWLEEPSLASVITPDAANGATSATLEDSTQFSQSPMGTSRPGQGTLPKLGEYGVQNEDDDQDPAFIPNDIPAA